ncbi:MAG: helix-turn-helix transcriptional regulator [Polyangia bacterium]|jgi:transcriptional regulator with XRE-family HTH domain|nr:helix-turn-helix transcriptional regulator [Polyangia bacterium]
MPTREQDQDVAKKLKQTIGANLRQAREALGWTQELAAERVDIAVESYARIERGLSFPSFPTLIRTHIEMGVSPNELLGLVDARKAGATQDDVLTEQEQAISRISAGLRSLDTGTVAAVEALVRGLRRA